MSLFFKFQQAQMARSGNISKSVPTQGWQNCDACDIAGAVQSLKCSLGRSLNFNENGSQGMTLNFVNFLPRYSPNLNYLVTKKKKVGKL